MGWALMIAVLFAQTFCQTNELAKYRTVTVGTFNVQNLFDAYDDPYVGDENRRTKAPASLIGLAGAIRRLDADVLALQEVENRGVLVNFIDNMVPKLRYRFIVLIRSNDGHGINLAVVSRLPVGAITSYQNISFRDAKGNLIRFGRDLLRVRIEPADTAPFEMFVVHLKSKIGPEEGLPTRLGEARAVRGILDGVIHDDPDAKFVVCGDFNDTWDSEVLKTLRGEGRRALSSAHYGGAETYNKAPYRSMIDFILSSPSMSQNTLQDSYRVVAGGTGSDHNPVAVEFRLKSSIGSIRKYVLRAQQQRFEQAWKSDSPPSIENYLHRVDNASQGKFFRALLSFEVLFRSRRGEHPSPEEYEKRFPQHSIIIDQRFHAYDSH